MSKMKALTTTFDWLQNQIKACEEEMRLASYLGRYLDYEVAKAQREHLKNELRIIAGRMLTLIVNELAD